MRIRNPSLAFDYVSSSSLLHTMDARKRLLLYFFIQLTVYRVEAIGLHCMAVLICIFHLLYRVPLQNFFRALRAFSLIIIIILLSSLGNTLPLEGFIQALFRCEQIIVSLLYTNMFLASSTQQSIIRTMTWLMTFLPNLSRRYITVACGFCFTFLQLIFREAHSINEALQLRPIRSKIRYMTLFSTALLKNLCADVDAIHDKLEARNYQINTSLLFTQAQGENILCCIVIFLCIAALLFL